VQEARPDGEPTAAVIQGAPNVPASAETGEGTRRRRDRRRGGRDRGERGEGGERAEPRAPTHAHEAVSGPALAKPVTPPAPEPMLTASEPMLTAPEPMLTAHKTDTHAAPAEDDTPPSVWTPVVPDEPVTSKAPEPASALVSAEPPPSSVQPHAQDHSDVQPTAEAAAGNGGDVVTKPHAEPVRPRAMPELPKVSLELPPDSGLVLIETARERVAISELSEPAEPPRPRRVRPTRVEAHEEPLQLVETVHKDPTPPAA
jgi:hypothetical protein